MTQIKTHLEYMSMYRLSETRIPAGAGRYLGLLGAAALIFLTGCGGDWATATGKVSLDGKPLTKGDITFHPVAEGAPAYGQIVDGTFSIQTGTRPGVKPGSYKVLVTDMTIPEEGPGDVQAKLLTPEKYKLPETTDLNADVKPGANTFNFQMRSTP